MNSRLVYLQTRFKLTWHNASSVEHILCSYYAVSSQAIACLAFDHWRTVRFLLPLPVSDFLKKHKTLSFSGWRHAASDDTERSSESIPGGTVRISTKLRIKEDLEQERGLQYAVNNYMLNFLVEYSVVVSMSFEGMQNYVCVPISPEKRSMLLEHRILDIVGLSSTA